MNRRLKVCGLCILASLILCGCDKSSKYYYESAITELNNKNYTEADTYIKSAIETDPDNEEYQICSGMIDIGLGKYDEAITVLDKSITTNDNTNALENSKNAYRGKGIAYMKLNKYAQAAQAFQQALDCNVLEEIDLDILKYRADCLVKAQDYKNALSVCEKILNKEPEDIKILNLACTCYSKTGDTDKAKQYLDKVSTLGENSGAKEEIYSDIITSLVNAKEYKQALTKIAELGSITDSKYKQTILYNEIVALEGQYDFKNAYIKAKAYMSLFPNDANMKRELQFLETRISN